MKITLALLCLFLPLAAKATDIDLQCVPPMTFDDGTPMTGSLGFNFYGALKDQPKVLLTPSPLPDCASKRLNVRAGVQCYEVTAVLKNPPAGVTPESAHTAETCIPVDVPPVTCPAQPAPETRAQACVAPLVGSFTQSHGWTAAAAPACWVAEPWSPATAPAGVCASQPPLTTVGTLSYMPSGNSMTAVGLIVAGQMCGPDVKTVAGVKYCRITRNQTDFVNWPADLKAVDIWAKASQ